MLCGMITLLHGFAFDWTQDSTECCIHEWFGSAAGSQGSCFQCALTWAVLPVVLHLYATCCSILGRKNNLQAALSDHPGVPLVFVTLPIQPSSNVSFATAT